MFLDDPLRIGRRYLSIPSAFRIDQRDRPIDADPQALALGAITRSLASGDVELLHPLLYIFPGLVSCFRIAAIWTHAEHQMSMQLADSKLLRHRFRGKSLRVGHGMTL